MHFSWKKAENNILYTTIYLSIISVFSSSSASFIVVLCFFLLHMSHSRYFKNFWTGNLEAEENFLLY